MAMERKANDQSKEQLKIRLTVAVLLLVALAGLVGISVTRHGVQAAPQMTYTQLPMPSGKDVRRASIGLDEMYNICGKRMSQEATECARLGISREESKKRIHAVHDAGQAEISRVIASHYKEVFDPTVMDKAVRDVEERR